MFDNLGNIRSPSSLHRDEIIKEFLLRWIHLRMFDHSPTSDVLFLLITMRLMKNFSHHRRIRQYLLIDKLPILFFSSSKWDHWRISLIISAFDGVSSSTNIRCRSWIHADQIIEEFLLGWKHSPIFEHCPTRNILLSFIGMISLKNFS